MRIANEHVRFPKVRLIDPDAHGYLHIAAEIERPGLFRRPSAAKRRILTRLKVLATELGKDAGVIEATVFTAALIPPGHKAIAKLKAISPATHVALFDVALLVQTQTPDAARTLQASPAMQAVRDALQGAATHVHEVSARNAKRIGPVNHQRPGIFLFNHFYGPNQNDTLGIWEYTAGWFTATTGLDNSTLLLPLDGQQSQYIVVNHCRWDSLFNVLPHLVLRPTFRQFVEDNFDANNVVPMPILYRMA